MELDGRVALVTGAGGSGTGRAIALRFARDGAGVVVTDIDEESGHETVARIEADGGRGRFVAADMRVEADVRRMVDVAVDTFGGVDVIANSAGGVFGPPFPEAPPSEWGGSLDLHLRGPMLAIQHAMAPLAERGGGVVVNIASVAGLGYQSHEPPEYAASKAGLIRLTAAVAPMAERHGVRVNCVIPDWIGTESVLRYVNGLSPEERAKVPPELTPPEEIADAVVWFIRSDLAGRVMVCWCGQPWGLVPVDDRGHGELQPCPRD